MAKLPNSPGAGGSVPAPPASPPAGAAAPPAPSCRNCAHARLHLITFPDVEGYEREVRDCDAGMWSNVVNSETFFQHPKQWLQRAADCPAYRRKLGAR